MSNLYKRLRQRFGISAPRMTVRTHLAWYWRWVGIVLLIAAFSAVGAWMYDAGRRFAGFDSREVQDEIVQLRRTVSQLKDEASRLRTLADAADARVKIEQSAQTQLAAQAKQ